MAMTEESTSSGYSEDEFPMIVSVDDHVVEPPHLWTTWLPQKF